MEDTYIYSAAPIRKPRKYGLSNLVGDLMLTGLTGGLWAIWWAIREVKRCI